jgi:hypothetical protein
VGGWLILIEMWLHGAHPMIIEGLNIRWPRQNLSGEVSTFHDIIVNVTRVAITDRLIENIGHFIARQKTTS